MTNLDKDIERQKQDMEYLKKMYNCFKQKPAAEKTRGYLRSVLQEVEKKYQKFEENHDVLCTSIRESSLQERDVPYLAEGCYENIHQLFMSFKGDILDLIPEPSCSNELLHSTLANLPSRFEHSVSLEAKLPRLSLPTFSGEYMDWTSFKDLYCSLVHNNSSLSKIQKFFYLKSTLQGEPLNLIKSTAVTEANYSTAWSMLEKRYDNKRLIADNLIKRLFNVPKCDGSYQKIKDLLNTSHETLSALQNLGINTDEWDPLLIHLFCQKLDAETRKDWETSLKSTTQIPSIQNLFDFLETTFRALESIQSATTNSKVDKSNKKVNASHTSQGVSCLFCEKQHYLSKCYKFLALSHRQRIDFLSKNRICENCLIKGHHQSNCKSTFKCATCQQPHHTVLHQNNQSSHNTAVAIGTDSQQGDSLEESENESQVGENFSANHSSSLPNVLLATIRLQVKSKSATYTLRALLDQGSQATLISENIAQLFKLSKQRTYCKLSSVGDTLPTTVRNTVNIDLYSSKNNFVLSCNALVVKHLSAYAPSHSEINLDLTSLNIDFLADPLYSNTDPIDIILGCDTFHKIIKPGECFIHDNLVFQNTQFGWVFCGPTNSSCPQQRVVHSVVVENILKSFWEQEEISSKRAFDEEEKACEKYFENTTTRDTSGRYIVKLPFKSCIFGNDLPELPNNHINALKRFHSLENKFLRLPNFREMYQSFMQEYEPLNHMVKVGNYPADIFPNTYFLPHHGVFKEDSTTTKLRVVFDGSSKFKENLSLNDALSAGPALQNNLYEILTRWRIHKIAFSADIEKMFRQIDVHSEHQGFQQILWRYSHTDPISIYKLTTVTYGTAPAPFLAIRVLRQIATDYSFKYPTAAKILWSDSYVDDIILGADNLAEAISLQKDLCNILKEGKLNLRKWISNSLDFIQEVPQECRETSFTHNFEDLITKALDIQWNTTTDTFGFSFNLEQQSKVTKRTILSDAARLFDPLGWLTPSTVMAKIMFQKLWLCGADWDDEVPVNLKEQWIKYRESLCELQRLQLPRWIGFTTGVKIDLHGFCDSSQVAFAAAVYSRIDMGNGDVLVFLLQAKSKVAPIKTVTIPRLELCAAALLVRLMRQVLEAFGQTLVADITNWSDRPTVLSWLKQPPGHWNVYVANRVGEIQRLSNMSQWRYVPTSQNPADCASRGMLPADLISNEIWWSGPTFLRNPKSCWPKNLDILETTLELKKPKRFVNNINVKNNYPDIISRFSSLTKLARVIAYCLRFVFNCKAPRDARVSGILTAKQMHSSIQLLIKVVQQKDFESDILSLQKKDVLKNKSLRKLMPFVDDEGILRVGGRLQNSNFSFDKKHPILLSKSCPLSTLIILDAHHNTLHGGLTLTMAYVNRKYWIISGVQLAKRVIQSCLVCFRYTAKTSQQIMGNLPSVRLNVTRAFKHSGVDYAGPILMKNSNLRSTVTTKGYICLFVCMVTKAIHLEAVSDMTTNAFILAFRRFVSRRGTCTDLYSDCGTNFVGASTELKVLLRKNQQSLPTELLELLTLSGTDWHFIPPASPNFGGLWEAGVKSVKYHLKRIMGDRILTFEELSTLLCQIESCLNSRPLCPLSTDPQDVDALTPGHFLIGEPTAVIAEETLLEHNINRLARWKVVEKLKQHFWQRWLSEYINRLQARPKWLTKRADVKIGDLVLVTAERCPPGQWVLGRIHDVHPGKDKLTRVVTIFTKNKFIKRPINKICLLPTDTLEAYSKGEEKGLDNNHDSSYSAVILSCGDKTGPNNINCESEHSRVTEL